jgi:hypothetical protein
MLTMLGNQETDKRKETKESQTFSTQLMQSH